MKRGVDKRERDEVELKGKGEEEERRREDDGEVADKFGVVVLWPQ